jgi:hypothetical protein
MIGGKSMTDLILTLRELNRMTLARQYLMERQVMPVTKVVERLVGLQAQTAQPPFIGLWTRIKDLKRADLADLIQDRTIIKASLMRATLHLFTAKDFVAFRHTLQPALDAAASDITSRRGAEFDVKLVLDTARKFIPEQPRTYSEISDMLATKWPEVDIGSMLYTVRTHIPMVQVPVPGGWCYPGKPHFTLAEEWLGKSVDMEDRTTDLVFRYLAAFGPASVIDMQTWSGLPNLKPVFENLRPELAVYRDESKRELFDVPAVRMEPVRDIDEPVPVRFLPEFDNLLLSHSNRRRVLADIHRSKVFLPGLRVAATILVDGFVAGVWKTTLVKGIATLTIEPFNPLDDSSNKALVDEAENLIRFIEPDAKTHQVQIIA